MLVESSEGVVWNQIDSYHPDPSEVRTTLESASKIFERDLTTGDLNQMDCISEDGSGGDPFPYARDVSRLDFYSLTDHLNVRGEALNNMGKVGNDYGEGVLPNEWK
jgi:hypothetical protein